MFVDDFVGLSTNTEDLHKLIDVAEGFCKKWRLKSNITNSAVMVFSKGATTGVWKWGDKELPTLESYCDLGIEIAYDGSWDSHVQKVISNDQKKTCYRLFSNRSSRSEVTVSFSTKTFFRIG